MRFVTPPHESAWMPVNPGMDPTEFAHYKAGIQEYARQSGQSVEDAAQFFEEMNDVAATSAELDRKIADERRKLELAKLNNRLDRFDDELKATKRANRSIELSNHRPDDMSDPRNLPASTSGGYEEPRWQADRRAEEEQAIARRINEDAHAQQATVSKLNGQLDAASFRTQGGYVRTGDMGNPNLPGAPEHTPSHEFDNHMHMDGTSDAEIFVALYGGQLKAGPTRG